jgi:hypothetical protein
MNARKLTIAASLLAAAGTALAGDVDPFAEYNQPTTAQATSGGSTSGMQFAHSSRSAPGPGTEYTNGHSSTQTTSDTHNDAASVRSREEVHREAVQTAKERMVTGVQLLPGNDY